MHIHRIELILPYRDTLNHTQALSDDACNGLKIDTIVIVGNPDQSTKESWMKTDYMGVMINSANVLIDRCYAEGVHIPLKLIGKNSKCKLLETLNTSGDGFQLCGDYTLLEKADVTGLLDIYPYHVDHSDVGMLFPVRGSKVLKGAKASNITLHKSGHKWEHPNPQGILAPDDQTDECTIEHCHLVGVHREHGVRFGLATNCTVKNVTTNGAIAYGDRKRGQKGHNNRAIDCDAPRIVFEDNSQAIEQEQQIMTIDRKRFFDEVRDSLFHGELTQEQVSGMDSILDAWESLVEELNANYVAYSMATVYHETNETMQPIKEYGGELYLRRMYDIEGDRPHKAKELGNCYPGDGIKFCGMGFVQLTGRGNYEKQGKKNGVDLVNNPELMLEPALSAKVLVSGMLDGDFTGRGLSDYVTHEGFDVLNARRIINGTDKAGLIAGYYEKFMVAVIASLSVEQSEIAYDSPEQAPGVQIKPAEDMTNYYDPVRDGPITPEPIPEPAQVAKPEENSSALSRMLSGKKTHIGMLISGGIGAAAMFGLIPGMTAEAGANMLQSAFAISGTRSAIPKLMIMGIKAYASQKVRK